MRRWVQWAALSRLDVLLKSGDRSRRRAAVEALAGMSGEDALERLLGALQDKDWSVRTAALEGLAGIPDAPVARLVPALRDPSGVVRTAARKALRELTPSWAEDRAARLQVPDFVKALNDPDKGVRGTAEEVLEEFGIGALPALVTALRHRHSEIRQAAWRLLSRTAPDWAGSDTARQQIPAFVAALGSRDLRRDAMAALTAIGDAAIDPLIRALGSEDRNLGRAAEATLAQIGSAAVTPVETLVHSGDESRQLAAIRVLGEIGGSRALSPLIAALRDSSQAVRQAADQALSTTAFDWSEQEAASEQIPEFIAALRDADWRIRRAAARALGTIGNPEAIPSLIAAHSDESWDVAHAAGEALLHLVPGWPSSDRARRLLAEADRTRRQARQQAAEARSTGAAARGLADLIADLRSAESAVRLGALESLAQTAPDWAQRDAARRQVPDFIEALSHADSEVRSAAVEALGDIRDPAAIPALARALSDGDEVVRLNAGLALQRIDPDWRDKRHARGRADELIEVLAHADRESRHGAAQELGTLGDPRALPALMKALLDKDASIRRVARRALDRISPDWPLDREARRCLPDLVRDLCAADQGLRSVARQTLERIDPGWSRSAEARGQVGELTAAFESDNPAIRKAAAEVLGEIGDPRATTALIRALTDADSEVRDRVLRTLDKSDPGWAQAPAARDLTARFILALRDPDLRWNAEQVLERIGESALDDLIAALRNGDRAIRRSAGELLEKISPRWPESEAAHRQMGGFIAALLDRDNEIRHTARSTLERIAPHWPESHEARRQAPELIAALEDGAVQREARELLVEIGAAAVAPLCAALGTATDNLRTAAAETLGRIGDGRALAPLLAASQSPSPGLRRVASWAIEQVTARQQPLLAAYPELLCSKCRQPPELRQVGQESMPRSRVVLCSSCGSSLFLEPH